MLNEQERELILTTADDTWRKLVHEGGTNLFTEEVLGVNNDAHHREWYGVLDDKRYKRIALAAPRGHTKSTSVSVHYPLKLIEEDRNIRILLVGNAEAQPQSFLREIKQHIERDQSYVDFAGQLKPKIPEKWTDREIMISRPRVDLKDPTISTVGVGGTILSKRVDVIICDDILSPENTRTFDARQKLKQWFYEVLLPILVPGGRVIFVGTIWHPDDLLSEILKDPSWDYRRKYKAVIEWPKNMNLWEDWYKIRMEGTIESKERSDLFLQENAEQMHEGMKLLWPKRVIGDRAFGFSFEDLYLIYRSNRIAFEKAYQNNIISREDQKFKEEWLERAKMRGANYRLVKEISPDQRKEFKALTGGIDLAAGEDEQDDDNAMLSLGLRRLDDMVQLLGIDRGKFTPKAWRNTISERSDGFKHDRILVESNAYQVSLKRDLAEKNLPIAAFTTGGEKFDPYIGVESLALLFENDRIILPYDKEDPYTIALVDQLVDELRQFPVGHTGDTAMALWFAYTAMRDLAGKGGQSGFFSMVQSDIEKAKSTTAPSNLSGWVSLARRQQGG